MTPYHYCHNNPINNIDPFGMEDSTVHCGDTETIVVEASLLVEELPWWVIWGSIIKDTNSKIWQGTKVGAAAAGTAIGGFVIVIFTPTSMGDATLKNNAFREKKKPKKGAKGKEAAKDVPSWAKGEAPYVNENGKEFAKRLCEGKYGKNKYPKGPGSEFNKIKKWGDRGFE